MILTNVPYRQRTAQRVGFVELAELSPSAPHYNDALDLDKVLRAMDSQLRVGFIYDPQDHRGDRWGVIRHEENGAQSLVRIVQTQSGAYQPPDQRVFLDLQKHRLDGPNGRFWIKDALSQEERLAAERQKAKEEELAELREVAAKHVRDIRFKGRDTSKAFIG